MGVSVGAGRLGMLAAQFEWLTEPGFRRVRAMPEDGSLSRIRTYGRSINSRELYR